MTVIVTQDKQEVPPTPDVDAEPVINAFAKVCKILAKLTPERRARMLRALSHLYEGESKP